MYEYFTNWTNLMVICAQYTHDHIDLLMTSTLVLALSTFLLYIRPGYFRKVISWSPSQEGREDVILYAYRWGGGFLIHVVWHVIPFVFIAWKYGSYYMHRPIGTHTLFAVLVIMVYMRSTEYEEVYDLDKEQMAMILGTCLSIYLISSVIVSISIIK